jgi:hypothetical protein
MATSSVVSVHPPNRAELGRHTGPMVAPVTATAPPAAFPSAAVAHAAADPAGLAQAVAGRPGAPHAVVAPALALSPAPPAEAVPATPTPAAGPSAVSAGAACLKQCTAQPSPVLPQVGGWQSPLRRWLTPTRTLVLFSAARAAVEAAAYHLLQLGPSVGYVSSSPLADPAPLQGSHTGQVRPPGPNLQTQTPSNSMSTLLPLLHRPLSHQLLACLPW